VNLTGLANSSCCCVSADWAENEFERPETDAGRIMVFLNVSFALLCSIIRRQGRGERRLRSTSFEHDWWLPRGSWMFAPITGGSLLELVMVEDRIILLRGITSLVVGFKRIKNHLAEWLGTLITVLLLSVAGKIVGLSVEQRKFGHDFLHTRISCGINLVLPVITIRPNPRSTSGTDWGVRRGHWVWDG